MSDHRRSEVLANPHLSRDANAAKPAPVAFVAAFLWPGNAAQQIVAPTSDENAAIGCPRFERRMKCLPF
jgi:hypothetical protein